MDGYEMINIASKSMEEVFYCAWGTGGTAGINHLFLIVAWNDEVYIGWVIISGHWNGGAVYIW